MSSYNIRNARRNWLIRHNSYAFIYYKFFDYTKLEKVCYIRRNGKSKGDSYNDVIIMADTETSKEIPNTVCRNYVVAWTISIRCYDMNIVTLYGSRPSEMVEAIEKMVCAMPGEKTVIYFHNLAYDWVFLRKFFMAAWGTPEHQLNTKPHYPIFVTFANGITLKDSYILAQRGLEKWAKDLDVTHKKASGFWDYDKIRNQGERFTPHEKTYIEHDTLAGVECIQKTMDILNKRIYSIPYTATGIPREAVQHLAAENHFRETFLKIVPEYCIYKILEKVFHGGYTHNNRHMTETIIDGRTIAYDFASSYPFVMLAFKFPMEKFRPLNRIVSPEWILRNGEEWAYMFRLVMVKPRLKDDMIPMPALQKSKAEKLINCVEDNGRVLCAEYMELWTNEIDLEVIMQQYDFESVACADVLYSHKDFLPRWFTDYIYDCFVQKCLLKGGDPVAYSLAKSKLNSLYGMCVQRCVKLIIEELYQSGDYQISEDQDEEALYEAYVNNRKSVLPYFWGVWVTSYAFRNLFRMGSNATGFDKDGNPRIWIYSDTDSCYGQNWNEEGIEAYNEDCKRRLRERGYGAVLHNNREYWLGICEKDGEYQQFISVGAKRYACRDMNGKLKITVAGVPKSGVNCLNDDLHNFHAGFIFDGKTTGKKQHTYFYEDDIYIDQEGNERGDSIDLSPADYLLDSVRNSDWMKFFTENIEVQVYDEKDLL